MKKMLAMMLIVATFVSALSINVIAAKYDSSSYKLTGNSREDIVGIAKTQIGYKPSKSDCTKYADDLKAYGASNPNQWCGYFVSWCAMKAGVLGTEVKYIIGVASAKKAGAYYTTSQVFAKKYTPQKGDIVIYGGSSSASGSHIGLVTTNATFSGGKLQFGVIEGNSGKDDVFTRTRNISKTGFVDDNWYIVGFVSIPYSTTNTLNPKDKPKVSITSYPKTINREDSYGLRGTINANGGSTEVKGYILDSKGKKIIQSSKAQTTTSSSFDIKSSNVNNQLCFDKLSAGKYKLRITATNEKGTTKFEKSFTVKEKGPSGPPKISVTSYPKNIKKGSSFGLRGAINANGGSTEVRGYILNSKGKTVQSTKLEKTSSSSFDIRYSNVNEQLLFDKLSKGTYTLKITAKNSKGTTNFSKKFTVK